MASLSTPVQAKAAATPTTSKPRSPRSPRSATAATKTARPAVKAAKPVAGAQKAAAAKTVEKSKAPKASKASKTPSPAAKRPAAVVPEPAAKPAKVKLVRDGFTMPADEYAALGELKQRAMTLAHPVKKSELLRAGVKLLSGLSNAALLRALRQVPTIKTGRPKIKRLE